jgi:hypothetical protein
MEKENRMKKKQGTLIDSSKLKKWKEEWKGMPEFEQEDTEPHQIINMSFTTKKAVKRFAKCLWFPKQEKKERFEYIDES